ncbi:TPA: hypothetical protein GRR64_19220 [Vibrio parahaemolyticus]|nr:hypothetical protein [Vibrio parahaemolyticus]HAS6479711.1 hypothetical protein [Vibrio parahaemolyticus]
MSTDIKKLEEEIEALKNTIYEMHKELIVHRQHIQQRTVRDLSGYVTIPNLTPATVAQLDDNTILVVQTADGTMRAYLSEIFSKLTASDIPDLDANKITSGTLNADRLPTIPVTKIPAAVNSATVGAGFGGYRYTVSGTTLNLFTS